MHASGRVKLNSEIAKKYKLSSSNKGRPLQALVTSWDPLPGDESSQEDGKGSALPPSGSKKRKHIRPSKPLTVPSTASLPAKDMGKRDGAQAKGDGSSQQVKGSGSGSTNGKRQKPSKPALKISQSVEADAELMAIPEDPQFLYPRTISAAEAGMDSNHELVHGFWVPSSKADNYRRIVEKFVHMCVHEEIPINSLIVANEDLFVIAEGLTLADETRIDLAMLRKWDAIIQTYLALRFPIHWLKNLLDLAKASDSARTTLPREIDELEREHQRLLGVANTRKEVYDQLMADVGRATKDLKIPRDAAEEINGRLTRKRAELVALDIF